MADRLSTGIIFFMVCIMKKIVNLFVIAVFAVACSPSTEITGAWKNPNSSAKVNSILVTALTGKANIRQTLENDLTAALQREGIQATKSFDIMPPTFTQGKEPDREELLKKINGTNVDAILTVALIDTETENRYVPGNVGYAPITRYRYYGRFWGYYTNWYPTLYSPGYYQEEKTYFLETNLYDAKTEELIWSAQSETYDPAGMKALSKELASVLMERMKKDGVIM
jgi:hypothetical protein